MPALNFTMFIDKVKSGEKRQTIRKHRKRPFKVGDKLYLYSGMRTKNCQRLIPNAVTVKEVQDIHIKMDHVIFVKRVSIALDGLSLNNLEAEDLAKADGFDTLEEFIEYFIKDGYSGEFKGQLIKW